MKDLKCKHGGAVGHCDDCLAEMAARAKKTLVVEGPAPEQPTTFAAACHMVAREVAHMVAAKNEDYGKSNILVFGEFGVVVRLNDKVQRLANVLQSGKEPSGESLENNWQDVVGYGIIGMLLQRGWFELE